MRGVAMLHTEQKHPSPVHSRILVGINAVISLYRDSLVVQRKGSISGLKSMTGSNEQVINLRHVLRVDAGSQILRFELQDRDAVFIVYSRQNEAQARELVRFVRQQIADRLQAVI
jgi:hypothetical protein